MDSEKLCLSQHLEDQKPRVKENGRMLQAEGLVRAKAGGRKDVEKCEYSWCARHGASVGSLAGDKAGVEGRKPTPGGQKCDSSAQKSHWGWGDRFGDYLRKDDD